MKKLFFCFILYSFFPLEAQISIELPIKNMVFQRDNQNSGKITISGFSTKKFDTVEAKLLPKVSGQGIETSWQSLTIHSIATPTYFNGSINGKGGWYILQIRTLLNSDVQETIEIENIGIGEIFIIAGQSNAQGQNGAEARAANDERVVSGRGYFEQPLTEPIYDFYQMGAEDYITPVGFSAWCWGELGDMLAKKLNVPILFFNTGLGLSSTTEWFQSISNQNSQRTNPDQPYSFLRKTIQHYINTLGCRTVLWHQGEAEAFLESSGVVLKSEDYFSKLKTVIEESRKQANGNLSWMIARVGKFGDFNSPTTKVAQNKIISEVPFSYAGPDTDTISVRRTDGIHFSNREATNGLGQLAYAWDEALSLDFFIKSIPIQAKIIENSLDCKGTSSLIGFSDFSWSKKNTGFWQVQSNENGNVFFALNKQKITNIELKPILTTTSNYFCNSFPSKISVENLPENTDILWNNGEISPSIEVKKADNYSAKFINQNICAESAVSNTIEIKNADNWKPHGFSEIQKYICQGDSISISTEEKFPQLWNLNTKESSIIIKNDTTLNYRLIAENGCLSEPSNNLKIKTMQKPSSVSDIIFETKNTLKAEIKEENVTFQWHFNSELLPDSTEILPINQSGNYGVKTKKKYELSNQTQLFCYSDELIKFFEYSPPLSIEIPFFHDITLFPNPSEKHEKVVLQSKKNEDYFVQIFTLNGTLILNAIWTGNSLFHLPELQEGMYFISIIEKNTERRQVKKMIVLP